MHELAAREKQFIDMQSALKNAKMARALDRWYAQFVLLRKQRVTLDRFVLRMKNVAIAGALDRWISKVKASKRQARVLERAVSRMTNSVVAGAFDRWQSDCFADEERCHCRGSGSLDVECESSEASSESALRPHTPVA
jgi:hypothetical protein